MEAKVFTPRIKGDNAPSGVILWVSRYCYRLQIVHVIRELLNRYAVWQVWDMKVAERHIKTLTQVYPPVVTLVVIDISSFTGDIRQLCTIPRIEELGLPVIIIAEESANIASTPVIEMMMDLDPSLHENAKS